MTSMNEYAYYFEHMPSSWVQVYHRLVNDRSATTEEREYGGHFLNIQLCRALSDGVTNSKVTPRSAIRLILVEARQKNLSRFYDEMPNGQAMRRGPGHPPPYRSKAKQKRTYNKPTKTAANSGVDESRSSTVDVHPASFKATPHPGLSSTIHAWGASAAATASNYSL
jgi:hypothetical protein